MPDTLRDRYEGIARRAGDPSGASARIADVLRAGKREQLLAGVDAGGDPFAPLSPATLARPRSDPTPLVPDGPASRLVTGYEVDVRAGPGRLEAHAGWPGLDFVKYHQSGTRRMPRRDPGGFRERDRAECLRILSEEIHGGPGR